MYVLYVCVCACVRVFTQWITLSDSAGAISGLCGAEGVVGPQWRMSAHWLMLRLAEACSPGWTAAASNGIVNSQEGYGGTGILLLPRCQVRRGILRPLQ